ncbi:hypothetical protein OH768_14315 [Streptomyces sp. NBC_01622]|uniref:hypothetical protein n=1 Tax=Streptomyces sp. NBC_01622 TaxID=2975903 RepID=UPI00386FB571|nr:hypothetical protein OH768_14315 [Streptomyces sp. NBC_01622]
MTSAARDVIPHAQGLSAGREPVLKRKLTDRWRIHVRQHVSSERVSATCEVFLVIAWFIQHCPWV